MNAEQIKQQLISGVHDMWAKGWEIMPIGFLFNSNGQSLVGIEPFFDENTGSKRALNSFFKHIVKQRHAHTCAMATEMYMAVFAMNDNKEEAKMKAEEDLKKYGSVSKLPQRVEGVVLIIWTPAQTFVKFWHIIRPKGEKAYLKEVEEIITHITEEDPVATFQNPFK